MESRLEGSSIGNLIGRALAAPICAALLVGVASAKAQTDPVKLLNTPTPAAERIAYGPTALNFGELRVPKGAGPFPVAILIHGGCWQAQLSEEGVPAALTSFELLRPAAEALARQGIATWNIEYPRIGDPGGGWPGTYRDISRATDYLRRIAGPHHLDLDHVVVIGHSSGGQLAMWLAIRGKLPKSSAIYSPPAVRLKGVIDIDGPPDLRSFWPFQQQMCDAPVLNQFLGGGPQDVPKRYSQGAVTDFLPVGLPQMMLIRDHPAETTAIDRQHAQKARQAGDQVTVVMQKGTSHFDGLNPDSGDWPTVVGGARAMLGLPPAAGPADQAARH